MADRHWASPARRAALLLLASLTGLAGGCSRLEPGAETDCKVKTPIRGELGTERIEVEHLGRGEELVYGLKLEAGESVVLEAEQRGADLELEVCDPSGHRAAFADTYIDLTAAERVEFVVQRRGTYRVVVRGVADSPAGGCALEVRTRRAASAADRARAETLAAARLALERKEFQTAIARYEELGEVGGEAEARQAFATWLEKRPGSLAAALAELDRVRALRREVGNTLGEAAAAADQCRFLLAARRHAEAPEPCTAAFELAKRAADPRAIIWSTIRLAELSGWQGAPPAEREAMFGRAVGLATAFGVPILECSAQRAVGAFLGYQGRAREAIVAQERAMTLCDAAGEDAARDQVLARNDLGVEWQTLGDSRKARSSFREGIELAAKLEQQGLRGPLLLNQGTLLFSLGRYDAARESYDEAVRAFARVGDTRGEVLTHLRRAALASQSGERAESLRIVEQAIAVLDGDSNERDPDLAIDALIAHGRALRDLGHYGAAAGKLEQAVNASLKLNNRRREMSALGNLGETLRRAGDVDGAARRLEAAQQAASETGDLGFAAWLDWRLALVHREKGDRAGARRLSAQAVAAFELINRASGDPESRATQLAFRRPLYEAAISAALKAECAKGRRGCAAPALELSERARARGLLAVLAERELDLDGAVPLELQQQKLHAEARQQSLLRQEIDLRRLSPGRPLPPALEVELYAADRELDYVLARIRESNPGFANLQDLEPLSVVEMQRRLVREPDAALIEFALGDEESQLFVVRTTGVEVVSLPPADRLAALVTPFIEGLRVKGGASVEQASALYDLLLRPAEPLLLGVSRLIIVPDGLLAELPFEVLVRRVGADGAPLRLLDDMTVSYAASATVLASLSRNSKPRTPSPPRFVAFANPFYPLPEASDERPQPVRESNSAPASTAGRLRGGISLPRLEGSQREVEAIARLFAEHFGGTVDASCAQLDAAGVDLATGDRPTSCLFLRKDAREEQVSLPLVAKAQYLHFAVHAISDDRDPDRVGLFLSQESGQGKNGLLELREIAELDLGADLVVLSACSSGLGVRLRGEGFLGFTWAFLRAGARSLVVSLWDVEDADTAALMERFYEHLLRDPLVNKAEALRQAKLDLIRQGSQDAHSWAAFVLIGER